MRHESFVFISGLSVILGVAGSALILCALKDGMVTRFWGLFCIPFLLLAWAWAPWVIYLFKFIIDANFQLMNGN